MSDPTTIKREPNVYMSQALVNDVSFLLSLIKAVNPLHDENVKKLINQTLESIKHEDEDKVFDVK